MFFYVVFLFLFFWGGNQSTSLNLSGIIPKWNATCRAWANKINRTAIAERWWRQLMIAGNPPKKLPCHACEPGPCTKFCKGVPCLLPYSFKTTFDIWCDLGWGNFAGIGICIETLSQAACSDSKHHLSKPLWNLTTSQSFLVLLNLSCSITLTAHTWNFVLKWLLSFWHTRITYPPGAW